MRRVTAALALALCLAGCESALPAAPVAFELAHSKDPADGRHGACSLGWWTGGRLVAAGVRGTSIVVEDGDFGTAGDRLPIAWWPRFTGLRVGDEVEILDPDGNVVAITGHRYRIDAAFPFDTGFVVCGNCGTSKCITELLGGALPPRSNEDGMAAQTISRAGG